MNEPRVTVIVPVKNSATTIKKCLDSLLAVDYSNYEITVVNDGSVDSTPDILARYEDKIRVIATKGIGPSAARNLAAKDSGAEYLAFTDSDCLVDRGWLKALLCGFEEFPEAASCGGIQRLPEDADNFEKNVFLFLQKAGCAVDYMRKTKYSGISEVRHNPSCNAMYKRSIFIEEGGFLDGFWPGEDVELDYRLVRKGLRLVFNPKAVVYHYRPKDLKSFINMMYRYGWAQGVLVRKYGLTRKIQLLPLVLFALLVSSIFYAKIALGILGVITVFLFIYSGSSLIITGFILAAILFWNIGLLKGVFVDKLEPS